MPLKRGASQKTVASNISELVNSYRSSGRIGTSRPENARAARQQAVAIALDKMRESKGARR